MIAPPPEWMWWAVGGATLGTGGLMALRRRGQRRSTGYGTSAWATLPQMESLGLLRGPGVIFGSYQGRYLRANLQSHVVLFGPTRCHAPGTEILMYDGRLKCIETIQTGDEVMGPDSTPRKVREVYSGHGEMVRIIPKKGEPFVVSLDHVLVLKRTNTKHYTGSTHHANRSKEGAIVEITVRDWLATSRTFRHIHKLFRVGVEFPAGAPLPIHPYLLGVILGDGSISQGYVGITNANKGRLKRKIAEILAYSDLYISRAYDATHNGAHHFFISGRGRRKTRWDTAGMSPPGKPARRNPLVARLKVLGLMGTSAGTKFIPLSYKTASRADRLWLLAGLLDTDGHLRKAQTPGYISKSYEFVSKSRALVDDVCFLVRSLGFAAYAKPTMKSWQHGRGLYYRVSIYGATHEIPCQIKSKQVRLRKRVWGHSISYVRCDPFGSRSSPSVTGFTVEPIGDGRCYGIHCDGDQRYLMADFTVTHNSGKGINAIVPTLLTWPYSVVVLDPKGENYDITGDYRARPRSRGGLGQDVYRFSLMDWSGHRCNWLDWMRWKSSHEVDDVERLDYGLCAPTARPDQRSEFWRGHAYDLLRGLILFIGQQLTYLRSLAGLHTFMTDLDTTLPQKIQMLLAHPDPIVQREAHRLKMLPAMEQAKLWDSALLHISLWSNPHVAHCTNATDFSVEDLQFGPRPVTLYLQVRIEDLQGRYCELFRVFVDQLVYRLMDGRVLKPRRPVLMILDEAGLLRHMEGLETLVSDGAGYGVVSALAFQSPNQLERWYGEKNSITDNCRVRVFFPPNDVSSAALYERYLGTTTVREEVRRTNDGFGGGGSSEVWHSRPLQFASEVLEWGPDEVYARVTGCKPLKLTRIQYYADPWFRRKLAA